MIRRLRAVVSRVFEVKKMPIATVGIGAAVDLILKLSTPKALPLKRMVLALNPMSFALKRMIQLVQ